MPEQELRMSPRQHCPFLAELSLTSELATALFSLFGGKNSQKFLEMLTNSSGLCQQREQSSILGACINAFQGGEVVLVT
jgi:hypothetical protein